MCETLPLLRTDLIIKQVGSDFIVKDPVTNDFFRLDLRVGRNLLLFDGRHNSIDLAQAMDTDTRDAKDLIDRLAAFNFFDKPEKQHTKQSWHYMLWPMFNPSGILKRLTHISSFLYSKIGLIGQMVFTMVGIALFFRYWSVFSNASHILLTPGGVIAAYIGVVLVSLIHESGHAMAITAFGGTVPEIGVILLVMVPGFYTDVSDSYFIEDRWKRVVVLIAGPLLELVIWSVLVAIFLIIRPSGFPGRIILGAVMVAGLRSLLFNLNPLIRTDGYFILQEILGVTNLYEKALNPNPPSPLFRLYALGTVLYSIFLIVLASWGAYRAISRSNLWILAYLTVFLIFAGLSVLTPKSGLKQDNGI